MKQMSKMKKKVLALVLSAGLALTSAMPVEMQVSASETVLEESTSVSESAEEVNGGLEANSDTSEDAASEKNAQDVQEQVETEDTETKSKEQEKEAASTETPAAAETERVTEETRSAEKETEGVTEEKESVETETVSTVDEKESATTGQESGTEEKESVAATETESSTQEQESGTDVAQTEETEAGVEETLTEETEIGTEETETETDATDEGQDLKAIGDGATIVSDDNSWTIYIKDRKLVITNKYNPNSISTTWSAHSQYFDTVEVASNSNITDASNMFSNCFNLKHVTIKGLPKVTNMSGMFSDCYYLEEVKFTGNVSGVTDMSRMFSGCRSLSSVNFGGSFDISKVDDTTSMFYGCRNLTNIDYTGKFKDNSITNMGSMFYNCNQLTDLSFLKNFATSSVSDMSSMFYNCNQLTDLQELKLLDTVGVENMNSMFSGCSRLTGLDLSNFDTKKVTNMSAMFSGCSSLRSITFGKNFSTEQVINMSAMFSGCYKLTELDLSKFNTSSVINMSSMFSGCKSLKTEAIDLGSFDTSSVTNMKSMFSNCRSLESLDLSNFDTANVTDMSAMFSMLAQNSEDYDSDLSSITFGDKFDTSNVTKMNSMFANCEKLANLDLGKFNTSNVTNMDSMFSGCNTLDNIAFFNNFNTGSVKSMDSMFLNCTGLTIMEYEKDFDAGRLTSMKSMFSGCTKLQSVTFQGCFNAGSLTNMSSMFSGCTALTSVEFLNGFNANNLTNMSSMFLGCALLDNIKFDNGFNADNLQKVDSMFKDCSSLTSIDFVNNFSMGNVTNMSAMFSGCTALTEAKFDDDFDTSKVKDMSSLFSGCTVLADVDIASFDTGEVTNMSSLFRDCSSLVNLDLSTLSAGKVTDMSFMLSGCTKLESVDLSSLNTSSINMMGSMFADCTSLESLDLSSFNTYNITQAKQISNLLLNCDSLMLIHTPYNLRSAFVPLPRKGDDIWYQSNGEPMNDLPTNYPSIVLGRNRVPVGEEPELLLNLGKTEYECGKPLDEAELKANITVIYSDEWGNSRVVTDYKMNFDSIDASVLGTQELIVTYRGKEVKTEIRFVYMLTEDSAQVIMPGDICTYNGEAKMIYPMVYVGETLLDVNTHYVVTYENNVNAGTAKMIIKGKNDYGGMLVREFEIQKKAFEEGERKDDFETQYDSIGSCYRPRKARTLNISAHFKDIKEKTYEIVSCIEDKNNEGKVLDGEPVLENGILTYDTNAGTAGDKAEITIKVTFANYEDAEFKVIVELVADVEEEDEVIEDVKMYVSKIANQTYNGSGLKPKVYVYTYIEGKGVYLKEGKDFTIRYENNISADVVSDNGGTSSTGEEGDKGFTKKLPYITITGKGNYSGTLYKNFHINGLSIANANGEPADGFTLKCTDQFVVSARKAQKPFSSLKYKNALKEGTDYEISLTAIEAYTKDGKSLEKGSLIGTGSADAVIPAGYSGMFELSVTGKGNYQGQIQKTIYAADKEHMIKNATITIGKNQKSVKFTGKEIELTPARYDASTKKYYNKNGQIVHKDNVFVVKCGKTYLEEGKDYQVTYSDNIAVGKAGITITGMGDYFGTKSSVFNIIGKKFNAKTIDVDGLVDMTFTGKPRKQANLTLHGDTEDLKYPRDYSITYDKNIDVGTAIITFTANPISGYTGTFKMKFKIKEAVMSKDTIEFIPSVKSSDDLAVEKYEIDEGGVLRGISYRIAGAKPSDCVRLKLGKSSNGYILQEGIDYTVSYKNNLNLSTTEEYASMVFKGKGNFTGKIWLYFEIVKTNISMDDKITVDIPLTTFKRKKKDDYAYQPKIKVMEMDKALRLGKDYDITYFNNTQEAVRKYLEDLENGTITEETYKNRPYVVITAKEDSGYTGEFMIDLSIFKRKLTAKTVYVVFQEERENIIYTGEQVTPEITLYYGSPKAVSNARTGNKTGKMETDEKKLTMPVEQGGYGLTKLELRENGLNDYDLTYGKNITAGMDEGKIYITGKGLYGGDITQYFTIYGKDI